MENLLDSKKEIFAHLDTIYANIEKAAAVSGRKKEDIQLRLSQRLWSRNG